MEAELTMQLAAALDQQMTQFCMRNGWGLIVLKTGHGLSRLVLKLIQGNRIS